MVTAMAGNGSKTSRQKYPWESWVRNGTETAPVVLRRGKDFDKDAKLSSLVSQIHQYADAYEVGVKTRKLSNDTLQIIRVSGSSKTVEAAKVSKKKAPSKKAPAKKKK